MLFVCEHSRGALLVRDQLGQEQVHTRLLKLEVVANLDQKSVRLLIGYTKIDKMGDETTELVKDKVLLIFELNVIGVLSCRMGGGFGAEEAFDRGDSFLEKVLFFLFS